MKFGAVIICAALVLTCACSRSPKPTPRPVAYPYIERAYDTAYCTVSEHYNLQLNAQADITDRDSGNLESPNFEVRYEKYGATLYVQCWHTESYERYLAIAENRAERAERDYGNSAPQSTTIERGEIAAVVNRTTGKTLTPFHFFVGDNSRNLAYGVVVADNAYDPDSIAPVYDYILDDILHLLNNWTTYKTR